MIHELQIHEAIIAGADAILLIVAALDQDTLTRLYETPALSSSMSWSKFTTFPKWNAALDLDAIDLLGINNRNLKTFTTNLKTTEQLADEAPDDIILVSESVSAMPKTLMKSLEYGANAILVGESLMRSHIPADAIQEFLSLQLTAPEQVEKKLDGLESRERIRFTRSGQARTFALVGAVFIGIAVTLWATAIFGVDAPIHPLLSLPFFLLAAGAFWLSYRCVKHAFIILSPVGIEFFPFFKPSQNFRLWSWSEFHHAEVIGKTFYLHFNKERNRGRP